LNEILINYPISTLFSLINTRYKRWARSVLLLMTEHSRAGTVLQPQSQWTTTI